MKAYAVTDVGRVRDENQDFFFYTTDSIGMLPNLFVVADGMGGHKSGDLASSFTVNKLKELIVNSKVKDVVSLFNESVTRVNELILEKAKEMPEYKGMGTTLVLATVDSNGLLRVANVGDSRLYLLDNDLIQITRDHSLVEEMVMRGQIDKREAAHHVNKNIITRAIGAEAYVEPEIFSINLKEGNKILMCTDGLTNMVPDSRLARIMKSAHSVQEISELLVDTANENGGKDNITAMVIDPEFER